MTVAMEDLQTLSSQTRALLTKLNPWAEQAPGEFRPAWNEHLERLTELAQFLEAGGAEPGPLRTPPPVAPSQWVQFGRLLRDKRNAAGWSRVQLARRAKISDATVKFLETARHPPSRATLIRLVGVPELKLTWAEVPGQPAPPAPDARTGPATLSMPALRGALNCFLAPGYDPLALQADQTRLMQGAGGYLEQSWAYLESASAAAYLALCQHGLAVTELRSRLPLGEAAKRSAALCGSAALQVLALGCGDGLSETQLVGHLLEAGAQPCELCLLDLSPPLLTCAYRHAAERLGSHPSVFVWGLLSNFYHLPQHTALHRPPEQRVRRLYTMLGQTWANLDHELRFVQQSLVDSQPDDLLLLDLPLVQGSCHDRMELRRRDRLLRQGVPAAYAQWLQEPLLRHCPQAEEIAFHWDLETHAPVPGSYALHAVATVKSSCLGPAGT